MQQISPFPIAGIISWHWQIHVASLCDLLTKMCETSSDYMAYRHWDGQRSQDYSHYFLLLQSTYNKYLRL